METKIKNPEFHARLKVLIGDMPPFRWAAQVGLSNTAFQRIWYQGTIPSPEKLVGIVESTGVSLDWLLLGRGPMYAKEKMTGQVCTEADDRFVGASLNGKIANPDFTSRLQSLTERHKSVRDFAIKCGIQDSLMRRYLAGEAVPGMDNLIKIAKTAQVSVGWLVEGSFIKQNNCITTKGDELFAEVPLVAAELGAGNGQVVDKENGLSLFHFQKAWLKQKATSISNLVLMFVRGDSMLPVLDDGDLVMVDQGRTSIHSGKIYAVNIGGDALYVKRLTSVGKKLQVISDNRQVYPPFEIAFQEARVIGQVIWCGREL